VEASPCLAGATIAAILLERVADMAFAVHNTRGLSLRAAAQLPGLFAVAALAWWSWRKAWTPGADVGEDARSVLPPGAAIDWIGAAGNYVEVHCGDRTLLCRLTMREVEVALDRAQFVRIHRSTIVRRDRVETVRGNASSLDVVLRDGRRLRIGQAYRARLEPWLRRRA
jgi:DNA-binding LytR/AlgR family response regulator